MGRCDMLGGPGAACTSRDLGAKREFQAVGQQDKTMPSAAWKLLFAAAMLPVLWTLTAALVELWQLNYASVNLSGTALLNAQAILSATVFCVILLRSGIRARRTA